MPPELVPTMTILQILVKQHVGDFGCGRLGGDAGADLMLALGAAVQARGVDGVPGRAPQTQRNEGITFAANSSRCVCAHRGGSPGGNVHE
jgi:hypothetical protein